MLQERVSAAEERCFGLQSRLDARRSGFEKATLRAEAVPCCWLDMISSGVGSVVPSLEMVSDLKEGP